MLKKRYIALFLVIVFFLSFLTACSAGPDDSKSAVGDKSVKSQDTKEDGKKKPEKTQEVTINEEVLLDQDGIKITAKSIKYKNLFGPSIQLLIENNSSKSVTVQAIDSSINDIMVDNIFSCDIAPDKKSNDEITFMSSDLEYAEITTIKEIELKFHIFDSESWDTVFDSDTIKINTSADSSYVQKYDDSGIEVLNDKDIRIIMKRVNTSDSFWGADVYVYIENNSDTDITVQARDVSINGFMVDPVFSSDIVAGKKAHDTITFMESDLEDNDISSIDQMELSFHIFTSKGWDDILDSPIVEVKFE